MGAAYAELARPVKNKDSHIFSRNPINNDTGSVGRVIIKEKDVRIYTDFANSPKKGFDVFGLVISRNEYQ